VTALSATAPGAGDGLALAHGIHYAIVAAGIVGILALLLPQLHERVVGRMAGPHLSRARAPRDAHEARVMMLRAEIASGALGTRDRLQTLEILAPAPALPLASRALAPAAFVASTAAAGVHAAMAPAHLGQQVVFGSFFLASATFQVAWAGSFVVRISRRTVALGAAANLAFVVLWAVARTVGVPGLMAGPEPVGPWDVTCVAWELVVVVMCLRLLGSDTLPRRLAPWHRWDGRVAAFAVGSAAVLAALSLSGFSG
jgi:hypothetical protein